MKIGYRTPSLGSAPFREKLQLAVDLGLQSVEVGAQEFANEGEAREARALADDMGIIISIVANGMNLCDPAKLDASYESLRRAIDICQALDVRGLFSRSLEPAEGTPQSDTWLTCIDAFRTVTEMCDEAGVRFAIEADPPCFIQNLERVERLIDGVCHPNFYVNFDPTNYYVVGSDPMAVIDRLGSRMINGHIKDGIYQQQRHGETKIGEGEVPYSDIFTKMRERNIDICMSIEHCKGAEEVREAAAHVKSVLAVLGM